MEGDERETPRHREKETQERKGQRGKERGKKGERDRENYPTQITQRKGARRGSEIPGCACKEKQKPEDTVLQGKRRNIQRANEQADVILELSYLGLVGD